MSLTPSGYFEVEVIETIAHRFQVKAETQDEAANEARRLIRLHETGDNALTFETVVMLNADPKAQLTNPDRLGFSLNRATPRYQKSGD